MQNVKQTEYFSISVTGTGFAGLPASSVLAAGGNSVTVYEKNAKTGLMFNSLLRNQWNVL